MSALYRNINDFFRTLDPWSPLPWTTSYIDDTNDKTVGSITRGSIHDKKNTGNITYTELEDGGVSFSMSVLGVSKDNVSVELSGNVVEVTAKEDDYTHDYQFRVNVNRFDTTPENTTVQYKNGLLVITFKKKEQPQKQTNKLPIL